MYHKNRVMLFITDHPFKGVIPKDQIIGKEI